MKLTLNLNSENSTKHIINMIVKIKYRIFYFVTLAFFYLISETFQANLFKVRRNKHHFKRYTLIYVKYTFYVLQQFLIISTMVA